MNISMNRAEWRKGLYEVNAEIYVKKGERAICCFVDGFELQEDRIEALVRKTFDTNNGDSIEVNGWRYIQKYEIEQIIIVPVGAELG